MPLKQIHVLIRGIGRAAQMRPDQKFIWRHFGEGPVRKSLQEELKLFPQNAEGYLDGYVPIEQIMNYYRENPVDVIVNVSEFEGGSPVSIMEALSCGIPAIATAVGGNPEIVSEQNGILLSANPSPDDVAEALLSCWIILMRRQENVRQVGLSGKRSMTLPVILMSLRNG